MVNFYQFMSAGSEFLHADQDCNCTCAGPIFCISHQFLEPLRGICWHKRKSVTLNAENKTSLKCEKSDSLWVICLKFYPSVNYLPPKTLFSQVFHIVRCTLNKRLNSVFQLLPLPENYKFFLLISFFLLLGFNNVINPFIYYKTSKDFKEAYRRYFNMK